MSDRYCRFVELVRVTRTKYPLEEHQRYCATCQADQRIEQLEAEVRDARRINMKLYIEHEAALEKDDA